MIIYLKGKKVIRNPDKKKIISAIQNHIFICSEPFKRLAGSCQCSQKEILQYLKELSENGFIKRFAFFMNYRKLGMLTTLVTGHVPEEKINKIADYIAGLPNVSHNYLRENHFNMWFTLTADSEKQRDRFIEDLSEKYKVDFYLLPSERFYKLSVKFNRKNKKTDSDFSFEPVELSESQKKVINLLQTPLEISTRPFKNLETDGFTEQQIIDYARELKKEGVIRKLTFLMDHYKLGFKENVMLAAEVNNKIDEKARYLCNFNEVSHCCTRKTFHQFPFNLFAMIHAKTGTEINSIIRDFTGTFGISNYTLLPTVRQLKKEPLKLDFK